MLELACLAPMGKARQIHAGAAPRRMSATMRRRCWTWDRGGRSARRESRHCQTWDFGPGYRSLVGFCGDARCSKDYDTITTCRGMMTTRSMRIHRQRDW